MDSQRQSSSFLDLLTSQLPNNENPSQLLSFSPSPANENPSQLLSFSPSPANENPSQLPSPAVGGYSSRAQTGEERKQRCKWSTTEDLVLISSWLNTSKDPVVGNEQKAGTFWKRIASYYNASPKVVGFAKREPNHCKQRWGKINEGVCKFVGSYDAASKQKSSG